MSFTDEYTKVIWKRMEDPPGGIRNGRGIYRFNGHSYVTALNGEMLPLRADLRVRYNYNGNPVDPRKEKKKPDPFALVEPIQREGNANLLQTSMSPVANQINASHSTDNGAPEAETENLIMDGNAMNMEEGNKEDDEGKLKEAKEDEKKLEDEVKKSEEEKKEEKEEEKNPQITLITEDMLKLGNIKRFLELPAIKRKRIREKSKTTNDYDRPISRRMRKEFEKMFGLE